MEYIQKKYQTLCNDKTSDINEHLPTLYKYATECESIIELGVRGCVSSWAFVHGLLNNQKPIKKILLNDIEPCDIRELIHANKQVDTNKMVDTNKQVDTSNGIVHIDYKWINDLVLDVPEPVDMTFIDTWHVYGQLKRELAKYSKVTKKYIIMHDTTVDGIYGETIRMRMNAEQQSRQSGFPLQEIQCGLQKAISEFIQGNPDWQIKEIYTNNNGLTILEKKTLS